MNLPPDLKGFLEREQSKFSKDEQLLLREWEKRGKGGWEMEGDGSWSETYNCPQSRDAKGLCEKMLMFKRVGWVPEVGQGPLSSLFSLGKRAILGKQGKAGLDDLVECFDKRLNNPKHPSKVRPQSAFMRRSTRLNFEVDGQATGEYINCLDPSNFHLPGGTEAEVRKVFEKTFGMKMPNFEANRVVLRMLAGIKALDDSRFYLAFVERWMSFCSPYQALLLANAGMLNMQYFEGGSHTFGGRAVSKKQARMLKNALSQTRVNNGFSNSQLNGQPANGKCFPTLRFYQKYKDLPEDKVPNFFEVNTIMALVYLGMTNGDFAGGKPQAGLVSRDFVATMLGMTQAPQGKWQPHMAYLGLIPHVDDVIAALDTSVSRKILDVYWELAELPEAERNGDWVDLDEVTQAVRPMMTVAAQAAWGANDTWKKLQAESPQWPLWRHLRKHTAPGFIAKLQVLVDEGRLGNKDAGGKVQPSTAAGMARIYDSHTGLSVRVLRREPITLDVVLEATGEPFVVPEDKEGEEAESAARQKAQIMRQLAARIMQFSARSALARQRTVAAAVARKQQKRAKFTSAQKLSAAPNAPSTGRMRNMGSHVNDPIVKQGGPTLLVVKGRGKGQVIRRVPVARQQLSSRIGSTPGPSQLMPDLCQSNIGDATELYSEHSTAAHKAQEGTASSVSRGQDGKPAEEQAWSQAQYLKAPASSAGPPIMTSMFSAASSFLPPGPHATPPAAPQKASTSPAQDPARLGKVLATSLGLGAVQNFLPVASGREVKRSGKRDEQ